MDEQGTGGLPPVRRRGMWSVGLVGIGLAAGLVLAGLGVASAQSSPAPAPSAGERSEESTERRPGPLGKLRGRHKGGFGHGFGHRFEWGLGHGAVHGEFTVALPEGGYRTFATQRGKVTAVSATSITVRSDDGYSRTYLVDDETMVNAGNDGIADVGEADEVRVLAVVSGGTARAVDVVDVTNVRESRERWMPRPRASASTSPSST